MLNSLRLKLTSRIFDPHSLPPDTQRFPCSSHAQLLGNDPLHGVSATTTATTSYKHTPLLTRDGHAHYPTLLLARHAFFPCLSQALLHPRSLCCLPGQVLLPGAGAGAGAGAGGWGDAGEALGPGAGGTELREDMEDRVRVMGEACDSLAGGWVGGRVAWWRSARGARWLGRVGGLGESGRCVGRGLPYPAVWA